MLVKDLLTSKCSLVVWAADGRTATGPGYTGDA
jgi:hypothetical protein